MKLLNIRSVLILWWIYDRMDNHYSSHYWLRKSLTSVKSTGNYFKQQPCQLIYKWYLSDSILYPSLRTTYFFWMSLVELSKSSIHEQISDHIPPECHNLSEVWRKFRKLLTWSHTHRYKCLRWRPAGYFSSTTSPSHLPVDH